MNRKDLQVTIAVLFILCLLYLGVTAFMEWLWL